MRSEMKIILISCAISLGLGAFIGYKFLGSEPIVREVEVEVVKEVIVEKQVVVTKEVIKKPDGTVIEREIIDQQTKASELDVNKGKEKVKYNQKKWQALAYYDPIQKGVAASLSYNLIGPFSVGAVGTSKGSLYLGVGVRF